MMVDVDHFKRYNDHHGHPAGDECLRRVAAAMAGTVRDGDLLARIGGEEFALLLRDGRDDVVNTMAERLGRSVAAMALPHGGLPPGGCPRRPVVTVSLGAAVAQPRRGGGPEGPEALMRVADAALYEAKRRGRNRWCLAAAVESQAAPDQPAVGVRANAVAEPAA